MATVGLLNSAGDHALILAAAATKPSFPPSSASPSPSSSASRSSSSLYSSTSSLSFPPRKTQPFAASRRSRTISCGVAIKSDAGTSASSESPSSSSSSSSAEEDETGGARIGARVRVTAPLKVYHVAKAPELDITGMEGTLKQYVCLWKGKRISANLPFKVEFVTEVEGRGAVKFFAHLRDDEFEYV